MVDDFLSFFTGGFAVYENALGLVVVFEDHVVRDRERRCKTHSQTVLGNKAHGDAVLQNLLR